MAKKKAEGGSAAKAGGRKSSSAKKSAADDPGSAGMSDELIGQTAGEIWHLLSAGGPQRLTTVKKSIPRSPELVLAAVGWLAREGKLKFASSGRSLKVTLR